MKRDVVKRRINQLQEILDNLNFMIKVCSTTNNKKLIKEIDLVVMNADYVYHKIKYYNKILIEGCKDGTTAGSLGGSASD